MQSVKVALLLAENRHRVWAMRAALGDKVQWANGQYYRLETCHMLSSATWVFCTLPDRSYTSSISQPHFGSSLTHNTVTSHTHTHAVHKLNFCAWLYSFRDKIIMPKSVTKRGRLNMQECGGRMLLDGDAGIARTGSDALLLYLSCSIQGSTMNCKSLPTRPSIRHPWRRSRSLLWTFLRQSTLSRRWDQGCCFLFFLLLQFRADLSWPRLRVFMSMLWGRTKLIWWKGKGRRTL